MRKEDTLALKGVAILMMLLYHLFYINNGDGSFIMRFMIRDVSLLCRFSEICYPVSLYVLLSGYGLYASYQVSSNTTNWDRAKNLYIHLWLIYLIILPIACVTKPDKYPGNIQEFLLNVLSLKTSYNIEQWFLLPYLILMLLSKPLFQVINRIGTICTLIISTILWFGYCYIWVNYNSVIPYVGIIVLYVMSFVLPFSMGALLRRNKWIEIAKDFTSSKINQTIIHVLVIAFFALFIICRLIVHNQSLQPFAIIVLVFCFHLLCIPEYVMKIFIYLGKHSLNVWLIHTWFCFYLFKDLIYSFKEPILIFMVTLLISLFVSHIVNYLYGMIIKIRIHK